MKYRCRIAGSAPGHRPHGFALLIALVLLALLVLLMTSLSILVRSETALSINSKYTNQSRQNALLGLKIALSQLQRYAGPDQRVTARADLVAGVNNPYLTGVWNADAPAAPGNPMVWLISGNESDPHAVGPQTDLSGDGVVLVGENTVSDADMWVRAPRQEIETSAASGGLLLGHYAWWVGDEGLKAKLDLVDDYAVTDADSPEHLYSLTASQRMGIELVDDDGAGSYRLLDAYPVNVEDNLSRVLTVNQFPMAGLNAQAKSEIAATIQTHFHDLTTHSQGLLVNTREGGLREDMLYYLEHGGLSGSIDSRLPANSNSYAQAIHWEKLRSYYELADAASNGSLSAQADTPEQQGIYPIFSQFRLFFGLDYNEVEKRSYLVIYPLFVLANPYNVSVSIGDLRMKIRGGDKWIEAINAVGSAEEVIQRRKFEDIFDVYLFDAGGVTFGPGEAKVFSLANPIVLDAPDASASGELSVPLSQGLDTSTYIAERLPLAVPTDKTRRLNSGEGGPFDIEIRDGGTVLQKVENVYWSGLRTGVYKTVGQLLVPYVGFPTRARTVYGDDQNSAETRIAPFSHYNMRAPVLGRPSVYRISGSNGNSWGSYSNPLVMQGYSQAPAAASDYGDSLLTARWGYSIDVNGKERVTLLDVPREATTPDHAPLLSLGQFRNASLGTASWEPLQAVGSSWAPPFLARENATQTRTEGTMGSMVYYDTSYILNESLWDRFFISTVPQGTTSDFQPGIDTLPNDRLRVDYPDGQLSLERLRGDDANVALRPFVPARYLTIDGAFNVNSTSVDAWRALLGSLRGLSLDPLSSETEEDLTGPYARLLRPYLGSQGSDDEENDEAWAGFRNLTDAQISALAEKIVDEVRLRGPFRSLGEFINRKLITSAADTNDLGLRGALQAAIDKAGINDGFTPTVVDTSSNVHALVYNDPEAGAIDRATGIPGWFSQGDLLVPLGPVLSARSDTFVIRSYGDACNSLTGDVMAEAVCEAVVQRLPEPYETAIPGVITDDEYQSPPGNFGRRFVVVSFRWLGSSDI